MDNNSYDESRTGATLGERLSSGNIDPDTVPMWARRVSELPLDHRQAIAGIIADWEQDGGGAYDRAVELNQYCWDTADDLADQHSYRQAIQDTATLFAFENLTDEEANEVWEVTGPR